MYGKQDAREEDIITACNEANIHHFISQLPKGYEAVIEKRGVKLSGGEKQRLSIARAILKNPKLLILDEATSALDSISENLIQAIEPLMGKRMSLVIAHRLNMIMAADEILVVKEGQIVERGIHEELLEYHKVYLELYETLFAKILGEN